MKTKWKWFLLPAFGLVLLTFSLRQAAHPVVAPPVATASEAKSGTAPASIKAEGHMATYPGAEVTLSTDRQGTLLAVHFQEKDVVKKGDLIAELQSDEERAALAEAKAHGKEARTNLWFYEREMKRAQSLFDSKTISLDAFERTQRDLEGAQARLQVTRATVDRLEAVIAKTRITAPIDGVIITRYVHPGETIEPRAPIVKIVDLSKLRIEAEVDEYDSNKVALGSEVLITAEGFDQQRWRGRVEEVPDAVLNRKISPQDPGKPTDTRVLLVKIALSEVTPLKLGQRVEVSIQSPRKL